MSIINTYNLFLSSAIRDSGTSSDFTTALFKPLILTSPNNWFTVRVGSVEIPYVFKLINQSNYQVNFTLIRNSITYTGTLYLSPGNYNILTLLSEFKARLASAITILSGWDPSNVLSFSYDRTTGFATFSMTPADSIVTTIIIETSSPVFLRCVGFTDSFFFGYTDLTTIIQAVSTQNVNVSQNTAVYIRSDSLIQSSNIENLVDNNEISNILAKIQINSQPQSYILWTNPTDLEVKINNRIIDVIELYVGSSTAYRVDLGNLDWSVRLTIHEWAPAGDKQDLAINMIPQTDDEIQKLVQERQRAVSTLEKLRKKLNIDVQ